MSGKKQSRKITVKSKRSKASGGKGMILLLMLAMLIYAVVTMGALSQSNYSLKHERVSPSASSSDEAAIAYREAHPVSAQTYVFSSDPIPGVSTSETVSIPGVYPQTTFTVHAPTTTTTTSPPPVKGGVLTVVSDNAHIRKGPGTDFEIIKPAKNGDILQVLSIEPAANGVLWYKVSIGEQDADGAENTGYICSNYIYYTGIIPGGRAYLTFDDGPSANTVKILDILDKYHAKATFFVIYSSGYPELYSEIIKRGHTLALHSYTHDYKTIYTSDQAFFDDLEKLSDHVYELTGFRAKYTRFPGGSSNTVSKKYNSGIMTRLTAEVEKRGYRYFDWNASSGDASGNNIPADKLVANVKHDSGNRPSVVLLMHDAAAKGTTVEALPRIIEYYQSRGYKLLSIDDDTPVVHHRVLN